MIKKYTLNEVLHIMYQYPNPMGTLPELPFLYASIWDRIIESTLQEFAPLYLQKVALFGNIKGTSYDSDSDAYILTEYGDEVMNRVWQRFFNSICFECVDNSEVVYEYGKKFLTMFLNIYNNTYDKYVALLTNLDALRSKLINGKESEFESSTETSGEGTNRFNDTPQNTGLFDDDEFTSNITQSETSGTSGTTSSNTTNDLYNVEKLALLNDKYVNVMLKWTNEFSRLFRSEV